MRILHRLTISKDKHLNTEYIYSLFIFIKGVNGVRVFPNINGNLHSEPREQASFDLSNIQPRLHQVSVFLSLSHTHSLSLSLNSENKQASTYRISNPGYIRSVFFSLSLTHTLYLSHLIQRTSKLRLIEYPTPATSGKCLYHSLSLSIYLLLYFFFSIPLLPGPASS